VTREELLTDWRRRLPSAAFVLLERDIDALIAAAKAEERAACERRMMAVAEKYYAHSRGPLEGYVDAIRARGEEAGNG
jgi:sirohydrochlorin ferrochelatase